ncbi:hypothetical protein F53441_10509 [Fusarium austroafricanum]|uniref:Uncharacterized protein n=1 Tax=Fusarium austroafricanum TaxID=2364996 RepID=A0A8H4K8P8_9HYPO|nr:hypothetical protein F53441_10509 [Fusarium austroafricanum]
MSSSITYPLPTPELRRLRQELKDHQSNLGQRLEHRVSKLAALTAEVLEVTKGGITEEERRAQFSKLRESHKHIQRIKRRRDFINSREVTLDRYARVCKVKEREPFGEQMEIVEKALEEMGHEMEALKGCKEGS